MRAEQFHNIENIEELVAELDEAGNKKSSQADVLVKLALDSGAELFHTPNDDSFMSFDALGHRETWPVRSKATRQWLTRRFYRTTNKAPNSEAMQNALNLLEAMARFDGERHDVHLRTAWQGESLFYDLCDEKWRAVEISKDGWRIVDDPPVKFRRYSHTLPQVQPISGGNLEALWKLLNISDESNRRLVESWLVASLIPDIPRPVLVLYGDQGSAKSSLCRTLATLVDPSKTPCLRTKDAAELVQALAHRFCAVLDNVSTLPDWLSDLLCCAVTGDGFTKRQLYSDDDDIIYSYRRALLFNGINVAITKPDLLDRSIIIQVERIADNERRDEREIAHEFENVRPGLLGAIFDRLSVAIRDYATIKPARLPRMADFVKWAIAATGNADQFLADFATNVERQNDEALDNSVVATTLLAFLEDRDEWSGPSHELHAALKQIATDRKFAEKQFPANPSVLGKKLREVRPNLVASGWHIDFDEKARPRQIHIARITPESPDGADAADRQQDGTDGTDSKIRTCSVPFDPWETT